MTKTLFLNCLLVQVGFLLVWLPPKGDPKKTKAAEAAHQSQDPWNIQNLQKAINPLKNLNGFFFKPETDPGNSAELYLKRFDSNYNEMKTFALLFLIVTTALALEADLVPIIFSSKISNSIQRMNLPFTLCFPVKILSILPPGLNL